MQTQQALDNPYQVLYWNPHIHSQKFAKMVAKYHAERDTEMLKRIAGMTNRQLLYSKQLNWRQRKKYRDWGFQVGREKIYLLPNIT